MPSRANAPGAGMMPNEPVCVRSVLPVSEKWYVTESVLLTGLASCPNTFAESEFEPPPTGGREGVRITEAVADFRTVRVRGPDRAAERAQHAVETGDGRSWTIPP